MMTESLPLYRAAVLWVEDYIRAYSNIANMHKNLIGSFIYKEALSLPPTILRANASYGDKGRRVAFIDELLRSLLVIKTNLRICADLRIIDINTHARLSDGLLCLEKQAEGWKTHTSSSGQASEATASEGVLAP